MDNFEPFHRRAFVMHRLTRTVICWLRRTLARLGSYPGLITQNKIFIFYIYFFRYLSQPIIVMFDSPMPHGMWTKIGVSNWLPRYRQKSVPNVLFTVTAETDLWAILKCTLIWYAEIVAVRYAHVKVNEFFVFLHPTGQAWRSFMRLLWIAFCQKRRSSSLIENQNWFPKKKMYSRNSYVEI